MKARVLSKRFAGLGFALVCFILAPAVLAGQEHRSYSPVYFGYSLPEITALLQSGQEDSLSPDAWYLLSGTVTNIAFKEDTSQSYLVEMELTDAQWDWFGNLGTYTALLRLADRSFDPILSTRTPGPGSGILGPHSKAIFMVRYLGAREKPSGQLEPIFEIADFKVY